MIVDTGALSEFAECSGFPRAYSMSWIGSLHSYFPDPVRKQIQTQWLPRLLPNTTAGANDAMMKNADIIFEFVGLKDQPNVAFRCSAQPFLCPPRVKTVPDNLDRNHFMQRIFISSTQALGKVKPLRHGVLGTVSRSLPTSLGC